MENAVRFRGDLLFCSSAVNFACVHTGHHQSESMLCASQKKHTPLEFLAFFFREDWLSTHERNQTADTIPLADIIDKIRYRMLFLQTPRVAHLFFRRAPKYRRLIKDKTRCREGKKHAKPRNLIGEAVQKRGKGGGGLTGVRDMREGIADFVWQQPFNFKFNYFTTFTDTWKYFDLEWTAPAPPIGLTPFNCNYPRKMRVFQRWWK